MSVIWFKVWFDLWHNRLRTLLVVISIAVGVFAVGTTFGMANQMVPAMDAAHHATNPSHVTMYFTKPIDRDVVNGLKDIPGIAAMELLNAVDVRYKIHPQDEWRKGSIMARDDFANQTLDVLQLKAGSWPEAKHLSIERMHAPFYGIDIGDQVIIEVGDQSRSFEITGKIRHPFVPPPSMYDWAWFFSGSEVMELFGIPAGKFSQLKFQVTHYSDTRAREVASIVKEHLSKQGIEVSASQYQDPNKHWGRAFVDGMTMVIQVLAVISMLLSVVLVLNTLTALITQQTNQIGVLKAIGSTSSTVMRVYMVGVIVYGGLALLVALPLGSWASYNLTHWFLGLYNIDYESFQVSHSAIIFQVIAALVVPIVAALYPILRGANITVRQAISSYGLGGNFRSSWFDRAIERISQRYLSTTFAISLVNTFRRKDRLILSQAVLAIAGVMFLMVMSLSSSLTATLDKEFGRRTHDIIVSFQDLQRVDRTVQMAQSVAGVEKAGMWLVQPVTILRGGQRALDAGMGSQLQGVPLDDPMYTPLIVEGRWLQPDDGQVIVMNKKTADNERIQLGDWVTLDLGEYGQEDWQVVGFYRVFLFFGGGFSTDAIYAPRQAVYAVTNKVGRASVLLVRTQDHAGENTSQVAGKLKDLFQSRNKNTTSIETIAALRKTSDISFGMVVSMLLVLAVLVALVGGIGLMGSLSISVIERIKEIGVMRAIGARSLTIMGMFMLEGVAQGILSWVISVPISFILAPYLSNALGMVMFQSELEYQYNYTAVGVWLVVVVAIASLASLLPARNASQVNVRESLSYE